MLALWLHHAVGSTSSKLRSNAIGLAAALALLGTVSTAASAQNLVTNGGFGTDATACSLTGWDFYALTTTTRSSGADGTNCSASAANGYIAQDLGLVPGEQYQLGFWAGSDNPSSTQRLYVTFAGHNVFYQSANGAFTQFTVQATAPTSGSNNRLVFNMGNNDVTQYVDQVSVTPLSETPPVTTTPEPSSIALLGTGLIGLVPLVRRSRRS